MASSGFLRDPMNLCGHRRGPCMSAWPEEPVPTPLPRTWTPAIWNPVVTRRGQEPRHTTDSPCYKSRLEGPSGASGMLRFQNFQSSKMIS